MTWGGLARIAAFAMAAHLAVSHGARAEVSEVRISKGYGILYLPLIVMQEKKLLEAKAEAAGLGTLKVTWLTIDGGNVINDAMIARTLDIAGTGAPGFITLWAKARNIPSLEVIGLSGLSATSLWLNTNNPAVKTLKDLGPKDRIALPGIKTSLSAVVLQMIAAQEFGRENYAKLDPLTIPLAHPDALAALVGGKTEVTAHFTSPPFSYLELKDPKIRRIVNSVDVIGNVTLDVTFATKRFVDQNPTIVAAFLAALEEANSMIARDHAAAARIYVDSSKVKVSVEEIVAMLDDKDTRFSTVPNKVADFAEFLSLSGTIKTKPASWKDLFIPALHDKAGS